MTDRELMQAAWYALHRLTDKVDGTGSSSSDEFKNSLDIIYAIRAPELICRSNVMITAHPLHQYHPVIGCGVN